MRRPATPAAKLSLLSLLLLVPWMPLAGCGTVTSGSGFVEPNALMAKEINNRVDQISYQHRQELLDNLLWLSSKAGDQAIPALLRGLHNSEPKVRSSCAWVLSRIRDRRVIPYLRELVHDPHESVRLEVARALVTLGDLKEVPTLISGLDSPLLPVRYNCHMALKDATQRDFGYDHLSESETQRKKAVLAWWQWWGEQSGDPWFAKKYAMDNGLGTPGQPPAQGPVPPSPQVPPAPMVPPAPPGPEVGFPPGPENKPKNNDNSANDPFKDLPDFEEIKLDGTSGKEQTPQEPANESKK